MSNRHYESDSGYNVSDSQRVTIPTQLKHESIIVNAQTLPSFGSNFTIDFRDKGCILHDTVLAFEVSAISGLTGTVAGYPNFTPTSF